MALGPLLLREIRKVGEAHLPGDLPLLVLFVVGVDHHNGLFEDRLPAGVLLRVWVALVVLGLGSGNRKKSHIYYDFQLNERKM